MTTHDRIAPSSMARILQCPGSVVMSERYPEIETPESREGTAAHWVFSETLTGSGCCEGQIAPNGVVIDGEMLDGAQLAVDAIRRVSVAEPLRVEQKVRIRRVHETHCGGTPDAAAWAAAWAAPRAGDAAWVGPRRELHVWDYKYGYGHVAAYENPQLVAYAGGIIDEAGIDGLAEQSTIVHLHVVQPRNYHRDGPVRTWSTTAAMLRGLLNSMRMAAEEALGPNPRTIAGPECKHCPARHACPTLQSAALSLLDRAGEATPLDLPATAAADELRRLRYAAVQLAARIDGLESQVTDALLRGEQVPHWRIERPAGREKWTKPDDEVLALGSLFGVPTGKTVPLTPKQARDKGLPAEIVAQYSQRQPGAARLEYDDGSAARRAFGSSRARNHT